MSDREQFLWCEKYRPKTIEECILPETTKAIFKGILKEGKIPNMLLSGPPGQGKTTVAKAICNELGVDYIMINGSDERTMDVFRGTVKTFASSFSLTSTRKVIILDESDYLTADFQAALRACIEEFSGSCSFIFTANHKSKLIDAIHSRCSVIDFKITKEEKPKLFQQLYKRIEFILKSEQIKFIPQVVGEIMKMFFPDYRRMLNELQKYSKVNGDINEGILVHVQELDILTLFKALQEKSFPKVTDWVVQNVDGDVSRVFRKIYDSLKGKMAPESIPSAILTLNDYQYKSAFVADQEINLISCLLEIMVNTTWGES